jgi:hypothetical protein
MQYDAKITNFMIKLMKQTTHVLRLTQLYNILSLFYYWLQISASLDRQQANIYKKLKIASVYITKTSILWDPFFRKSFMGSHLHSFIVFIIITRFKVCYL